MPTQRPFFENSDLDIWPWIWEMTLTLVLKKELHPKEYTGEMRKLYHLPFKSFGQCKRFCGQTNGQTDLWMDRQTDGQKTMCPRSIDAGT